MSLQNPLNSSLFKKQPNLSQKILTKFSEISQKCIRQATKFIDHDFPANDKSLHNNDPEYKQKWKQYQWLRINDFLNESETQLFKGDIEPNDILQGVLGDCYFLCTLASLAEWPQRIKKLFMSVNDQNLSLEQIFQISKKSGVFFVNLYIKGELQEVIVDDFFVTYNKQPCFTKSHDNELWVMILEKAWAKVHGNYSQIESGLTTECLHDLTGAPTKDFYTDDQDNEELWQNILNAETNQYVMTAGTANSQGMEVINDFGIAGGHAYSLLAGYEIMVKGQLIKLVKLRNPWGDKEWLGRFSDNSDDWNYVDLNVKSQLFFNRKNNDGIFFMPFEDFVQQFYDVQVCLVNDSFKYNFLKINSTSKTGKLFKIEIKTAGQYYFSINQQSKRTLPKNQQDTFKYPYVTLVFGKLENDGSITFQEDVQKAFREVWTAKGENEILEAGIYYLFAKVSWNRSFEDEFVVSSYGTDNVNISLTNDMTNKQFLNQVYSSYALQYSNKQQSLKEYGEPNIIYSIDRPKDAGYYYLFVQNKGSCKLTFQMDVNIQSDDIKFKKPYKGNSAVLEVKPGQSQIALLRIKKFNIQFGISSGWELGD